MTVPAVISDWLPQSADAYRVSVMKLQKEFLTLPQTECPVMHHFAPGVYARECFIPAGTMVIGKIHKHECLNILLQGEITVITETGKKRLTAPCTFVAPAFSKKAAYAHTDVIWTNVIATQETAIEAIESEAVCDSYDDPAFLAYAQTQIKE